jgi:hypothetical protein
MAKRAARATALCLGWAATFACAGCLRARATLPPLPPVEASETVGPLVPVGWIDDRVPHAPTPPRPDGDVDFSFRVRIGGPVVALMLSAANGEGDPTYGRCWDTLDGRRRSWLGAGSWCADAAVTWTLALIDDTGTVVNVDTELAPGTRLAGEYLISVADPGRRFMRGGAVYTLLVERPSGRIDRTTATLP